MQQSLARLSKMAISSWPRRKKYIPILAVKNSDDIAIESLRSMRTAIHFALSNARNNIVMISGPAPEVGKSFISTNLAAILAQSQKRVLSD